MQNATIDVRPVSPHVGAEIHRVDLRQPMSDQTYREIRQAFNEYGVIFFRDQHLSHAQHLAFSERFGKIDLSSFLAHPPGFPMIGEVRKEPEATRNIGGNWHSDHSFDAVPPLGSILVARELPDCGGDTLFVNMSNTYETLSDGLKKTLQGLRAVHSKTHAYDAYTSDSRQVSAKERAELGDRHGALETIHPVVTRHPETGRPVLFINPTYTVRFEGWTVQESAPLLRMLYSHVTRPEFTCRFQWREGSIAFWDNRSVLHFALNDYHGSRRLMERITIEGGGTA
jgi:taurine dioxygenase